MTAISWASARPMVNLRRVETGVGWMVRSIPLPIPASIPVSIPLPIPVLIPVSVPVSIPVQIAVPILYWTFRNGNDS